LPGIPKEVHLGGQKQEEGKKASNVKVRITKRLYSCQFINVNVLFGLGRRKLRILRN